MLAGPSFGGLYVLTFAARYPDEVAGMVLIDSTAPAPRVATAAAPGDRTSYDVAGRVSALASSSGRLGLGRLFATLSTNSVHRVIAGATHATLIAEQGDAAATTRAVLDVASSVRSGQPLAR